MSIWLWVGFIAFVITMLALDLGVFHRETHVVSSKEAFAWTGVWVGLSLTFNILVYFMYKHQWLGVGQGAAVPLNGAEAALQFFTGYVIELSLSMDNVFVIAIIFRYFRIPLLYQHRVLFWGILGAQVFRGLLILAGSILIERFSWMIYVFGALLIYTAVKMLLAGDEEPDPNKNFLVRLARKFYPVSLDLDGQNFFTILHGKKAMTPLFLVLLVVESTDVLFALDSIPAIFAITKDPFLVFTSNVFAILGLRSLYFALAAMIDNFKYLKTSLVFLLAFVGMKMLLSGVFHIPVGISLAIIVGILAVGILASLAHSMKESKSNSGFDSTFDDQQTNGDDQANRDDRGIESGPARKDV